MAEVVEVEDGGSGNDILSKWEHQPVLRPLRSLLNSRAFLVAIIDLIQILFVQYLGLPDDVWKAVHTILMLGVAKMAIEDGAEKFGNGKLSL